ncbi:acid phosphatase [Novosphingobium endophyticum]|uniref:5'-nucleotidase n=1 Tax=Novosphingobium endophyticum TaxID=1955250 RepID=A0A916TU47_9SPHN|nr:5'/3'-nucleotidase SurE [Novosphingobium endophyticum]GGC07358.1 acid phosphatase [Novosphingobium endophyticum]
MRPFIVGSIALALSIAPQAAEARNIVITNDDGLSNNVLALYRALKEDGHDVIVSVPCVNQSGMGTALKIGRPLGPLRESCRNGAAQAGAPGAGPITRNDVPGQDFHYVDGTPIMAMLYGVDVVGAKRWGSAPDLVLSGPNEGQNVGAIVLSSGTVSAAQAASVRGLSAIALSAGGSTVDDSALANPDSAKVAKLSAELVRRLAKLSGTSPILPRGIALNVNFPDTLDGATWKAARIGSFNTYQMRFVEDMAASASPTMKATARQHGMELLHLPGLSVEMNDKTPSQVQASDESVVYKSAISVSPMQAGYEPTALDGWSAWLIDAIASD